MARDRWTGVRLTAIEYRVAKLMAVRAQTTVAAIIRSALLSAARTALGAGPLPGGARSRRLRSEILRSSAEHAAVLKRASIST